MIWLLTNTWWLAPLGIVALACLHPAGWALLRRVPLTWWLVLAAVALLGLTFQCGRWYERSQLKAAQATAEGRADAKAIKAASRASAKADEASAAIQKTTEESADEVRTIVRTVRGDCPAAELPERVHDLGQQAVERARGALRPGPR